MPVTRAVVYTRVSTDRQERDGVSLDTQLQEAEQFCEQNGWVLVTQFCDVMSGRKDKRPQLAKLEAAAKAKQFDKLIVYKLDRLARSVRSLYRILAILEEYGIELVCLTQRIDNTPIGQLTLAMLAGVAQFEAQLTGERVYSNMRALADKGRWVAGPRTPLGYRYIPRHKTEDGAEIDGQIAVVPDEAEIVRNVFDAFLRLRSLRAVANFLNEQGCRTREGTAFRTATVSQILRNPTYIGRLTYGRYFDPRTKPQRQRVLREKSQWVEVEDAHEAIIPRPLWEQVQGILNENAQKHSRTKYGQANYAWSGLIRCSGKHAESTNPCDRPCTVRHRIARATGYEYPVTEYLCRGFVEGGLAACPSYGRVNDKYLNQVVIPALAQVLRDAGINSRAQQAKRQPVKPDNTKQQIVRLRDRREKEKDLFRAGASTYDEMATAIKKIDKEIAKLLVRVEENAARPLPPIPANFDELWQKLAGNPAAQGETLRTFIDWCEADRKSFKVIFRAYDAPGWPNSMTIPIVHLKRVKPGFPEITITT